MTDSPGNALPARECGECTLCCKVVGVEELMRGTRGLGAMGSRANANAGSAAAALARRLRRVVVTVLRIDDLDRDGASEKYVLGAIHDAHGARPEATDHPVAPVDHEIADGGILHLLRTIPLRAYGPSRKAAEGPEVEMRSSGRRPN